MTAKHFLQAGTAALAIAAGVVALTSGAGAQQPAAAVTVDADDVGGVVSGPKGPEAGVWSYSAARRAGARCCLDSPCQYCAPRSVRQQPPTRVIKLSGSDARKVRSQSESRYQTSAAGS